MRKGMTKYKAQQAYESVFELATQPNKLRSMLRGQGESTGTIAHMSEQITDAARRNGVPAEDVMRHALSVVRGHHYNEFFKAFGADDQKKMDEEARALIVLGATTENIKTSVKKRVELEPTMPQEATQP
jgi:23S rRNA maturation-related 3'-5' exoribonuclease YhaM